MTGRRCLLIFAALAALAGVAVLVAAQWGLYNVAATRPHTAPVYWLLNTTKIQSIQRRASGITPPDLSADAMIEDGRRRYMNYCVQCHGAPGIARDPLARGMIPAPNNLVQAARDRTAAELFWAVKHGVKSTGMPAWDYRMADAGIWSIVAFVKRMPRIAPAAFRDRYGAPAGRGGETRPAWETATGAAAAGDPARGKKAVQQYACAACHIIPGLTGPDTRVGPPLRAMGRRKYIAGVLANTAENMARWLYDPTAVDPLTAMPDLGLAPAHARDMAAYLATLK